MFKDDKMSARMAKLEAIIEAQSKMLAALSSEGKATAEVGRLEGIRLAEARSHLHVLKHLVSRMLVREAANAERPEAALRHLLEEAHRGARSDHFIQVGDAQANVQAVDDLFKLLAAICLIEMSGR